MHHKKQLSLAVSAALGLTALISFPGYALAQDQQSDEFSDDMIEEVVVTGSRLISQDGFGRTSPVTVLGMDEISSYGLTRVEDVLNNLPQIEAAQNAFISNGGTGTASLDLRGLGTNRTLVLINGRRMQSGGVWTEAPDINQIPAFMIERVEVLTGGASATYGADAVAGVVNFIMRKFDGVEIQTGVGAYQHNNNNDYIQGLMDNAGFTYPTGSSGLDGWSYNFDIAMGSEFADGRGNATAYISWRKNNELKQEARDFSSCALNAAGTVCGGSGNAIIPNFIIAGVDADGGFDWTDYVLTTLQPDSSLADQWAENRYNYNPINHFMRPTERWSAGAFVDYEINEHAVVYMETMLAYNETTGQIAESGTFFNEPYFLPLDNPLFPPNYRASLEELFPGVDPVAIYIGKRNTEGGPRSDVLTYSSFRVVAGVKGVLSENWDYDVSYLHGQTSSNSTYINDFLAPSITTAVDGDLCAATPGCIPYEVFTFEGVTPEAAASVGGTAIKTNTTSLDSFEAFVTGNTGYGFSAGDIIVAGGYQWLQQDWISIADTLYEQGLLLGQGGPSPSVGGLIRSNQLFVEANIPLIADRSWSQMMTLDLAYRWSDYSTTGTNSTYRIGIDWQAVDSLRLRTGYNRAVRAPSVAELFTPNNLGLWTGTDPCAGANPDYTAAQCANTGVTAAQYGSIVPSPAGQYNATYGGNENLSPEKADTFTVGLVWDAMDTMQISVDYWSIKIDDVISSILPEVALEQCGLFGSLCETIHRSGGGSLWAGTQGWVYATQLNLGSQKWEGVDLAWNWSLGDNWNFDLLGTYQLKKETTPIPNDPDSTYDCAGVVSPICFPSPDWRHVANATYDSQGMWAATLRWRYYSSVDYDGVVDTLADDALGAFNYIDLNGVFRFGETHDVIIGVNNVFDKSAPVVGNTMGANGNTFAGFYDTLGRYFFANLTLRW